MKAVVVLSVMVLIVAGCGSSSTASASPTPSTPTASPSANGPVVACNLVTQSEASALAGVTLTAITPSGGTATTSCEYVSAARTAEVLVGAKEYSDAASARAAYQTAAQQTVQKQLTPVPVSGVGDAAVIFHNGTIIDVLAFAKGSWAVVILVHPPASDSGLTAAGVTAAGRM